MEEGLFSRPKIFFGPLNLELLGANILGSLGDALRATPIHILFDLLLRNVNGYSKLDGFLLH